jgi:hypothetical protein
MTKVENLSGIHGAFNGKVRAHPLGIRTRAVADGTLTYRKDEKGEVIIDVQGLSIRRIPGDTRRFVRATRGPKGNRDKIIGLVDKD